MLMNISDKLIKNVVMFFAGFCVYLAIEIMYRNETYFYSGLMGGIALVVIDKLNNHISWDMDLLAQGFIGSCVVTFMELVIGLSMLFYPSVPVMWDYSNMPLNFYGVICLPFSIAWILLSLIGVFLADAINYYVFEELPVPYYKLFGKTLLRFKEKRCKLN